MYNTHTHLQELIEQAEGVDVVEPVVAVPVPELAVLTQLYSTEALRVVLQEAVSAPPLELLGPLPLQPATKPPETRRENTGSHVYGCVLYIDMHVYAMYVYVYLYAQMYAQWFRGGAHSERPTGHYRCNNMYIDIYIDVIICILTSIFLTFYFPK